MKIILYCLAVFLLFLHKIPAQTSAIADTVVVSGSERVLRILGVRDDLFIKLTDMRKDFDQDILNMVLEIPDKLFLHWQNSAMSQIVVVDQNLPRKQLEIRNLPAGQYLVRISLKENPDTSWSRYFQITGKNRVEWDYRKDRLSYHDTRPRIHSVYASLPTISQDGSAYQYLETPLFARRMLPEHYYLSMIFPGLGHSQRDKRRMVLMAVGIAALTGSITAGIIERNAYIEYLTCRSGFEEKFQRAEHFSKIENGFLWAYLTALAISGVSLFYEGWSHAAQ